MIPKSPHAIVSAHTTTPTTTETKAASTNTVSRRSKTNNAEVTTTNSNDNKIRLSLSSLRTFNRQQRLHPHQSDQPFHVIVMNVGSTLALICLVVYLLIMVSTSRSFSFPADMQIKGESSSNTILASLLSLSAAQWDPYGIADQYLHPDKIPHPSDAIDYGSLHLFVPQASLLRHEFARRYGGRTNARVTLQRGIQQATSINTITKSADLSSHSQQQQQRSVDDDGGIIGLAQRLQHAAQTKGSFRILITGSSAAAGLGGNAISHSYAHVLEQLVTSACAALGISLVVQNAAVEANTEFPSTWCLDHHVQRNHLPPSIDLMVWDFGDTTSSSSSSLLQSFEAYLRHAATVNSQRQQQQLPPLFIFRVSPSFSNRHLSLIQSYVRAGVLVDPVLLNLDRAAEPLLAMSASTRPPGVSSWLEFSGPPPTTTSKSSTTKSTESLSAQQHELIAWLMTMRLLSALEWIAADSIAAPPSSSASDQEAKLLPPLILPPKHEKQSLPPPILTKTSDWHHPWSSLVLGMDGDPEMDHTKWAMPQTQCCTSFDSSLPSNMQDLILSGTVGDDDPALLLRPKSAMYYNAGWVLDLDLPLKRDKRMRQGEGNQNGSIDTKKAYYGVSTSGTLRMFIPMTIKGRDVDTPYATWNKEMKKKSKQILEAIEYVFPLVVCQFAMTSRPDGCRFPKDLAFRIDGKPAAANLMPSAIVSNVHNACVALEIPHDARLTRKESYKKQNGKGRATNDNDVQSRRRTRKDMDDTSSSEDTSWGLLLEIEVRNSRLTWDKGPCSVSQVIWQLRE